MKVNKGGTTLLSLGAATSPFFLGADEISPDIAFARKNAKRCQLFPVAFPRKSV